MVLDSGSGYGILNRGIFEGRSAVGLPPGNFQSSLRDFSSLEPQPRTASWAKFSRPCGTRFRDGRSHADSETRTYQPVPTSPYLPPDLGDRRWLSAYCAVGW